MIIEAKSLERITERVFAAGGCEAQEAACIARHLVDSNLCGHDSHGVIRIGSYVGFMKEGRVKPGQTMTVEFETETLAVANGNMGFGQVIGEQAMAFLGAKAKKTGLALLSVRHSGHLGRIGDWAEQLAREDLISMHFVNSTGYGMRAAPFGGYDRRLSVCPLSICIPVEGRFPVLMDMTTTTVAAGKVMVARNKGEPLPPGTIVDRGGNPTTNPEDFYDGGALLTMAAHKGHCLNIVTDLLAGALSGGGCTKAGETTLLNNLTSIAIDPAPFPDREALIAEVKRFSDWIKEAPPGEKDGEVLLPGEVEHRNRVERRETGIPIDDRTWGQIVEAGESFGVTGAELEELAAS